MANTFCGHGQKSPFARGHKTHASGILFLDDVAGRGQTTATSTDEASMPVCARVTELR